MNTTIIESGGSVEEIWKSVQFARQELAADLDRLESKLEQWLSETEMEDPELFEALFRGLWWIQHKRAMSGL